MKRNFNLATLRFHNIETAKTCALLLELRELCGRTVPKLDEETGLYCLIPA